MREAVSDPAVIQPGTGLTIVSYDFATTIRLLLLRIARYANYPKPQTLNPEHTVGSIPFRDLAKTHMGVSGIRGTLFWGPFNKDYYLGYHIRVPIFGNPHMGPGSPTFDKADIPWYSQYCTS